MKDCLICGIALGMVAGALLYKYNKDAKKIVNDTEDTVKKEVKNIVKQATKKTN